MATHDANLGEDRMRRHFAAEVLFLDPADVPRAREALAAVDCEYTIDPDAHDPYSDAVFGMVTGTSSLEQGEIGDWLARIVGPRRRCCRVGLRRTVEDKRLTRRNCND